MQEKRARKKPSGAVITNLVLGRFNPKTENQERVFDSYMGGQNLLLTGSAGTGKTFLSLGLALRDVEKGYYEKVHIIRSIVPTRDPGFLPGSLKEKTKVYESPYYSTCAELYGRGDAYDILKQRGVVEFTVTSYVRGTTFNDAVIFIDEVQNMRWGEILSVMTRVGRNCRVIAAGDYVQTDLQRREDKRGILDFIKVVDQMRSFDHVVLSHDDILRSDMVKEFLIVKDRLNIEAD